MMGLVISLTDHLRARYPDAILIVNNGVFIAGDASAEIGYENASRLFERYASSIDGILVESAFAPGALPAARHTLAESYAGRGVSVLTVDFCSDYPALPASLVRLTLGMQAAAAGFVPYIPDNHAFDRLYPPSFPSGVIETAP
jgi:hypothetical protein